MPDIDNLADVLRWFGSVGGMGAAILIAGRFSDRLTALGFGLFCLVSVSWIAGGLMDGDGPVVTYNAAMLVVNLIGIWRYTIGANAKLPRRRRQSRSTAEGEGERAPVTQTP